MQSPVTTTACRRATLLAILTVVVAINAVRAWADASQAQTMPPPGVGPQAAELPPIVRTVLTEALAKEEEIRRRGWKLVAWPPVSFPLPTCLFEQGLCGAVNRDGSIAVAPRFDFVDGFHEGRAVVRWRGLYGYVDTHGKVVVEPQYAIAGRYRLGYAEVDIGGKSALIDLEGRQVLAPRFASALAFTKNVFWVNDGVREYRGPPGGEEFRGLQLNHGPIHMIWAKGKWGLVDATGTWIRRPEFRDLAIFDRENGDLMWARADSGWGLIRADGTWLVEPTFEHKGDLSDDRAAVSRGGKTGYINQTGRIVIPLKFDILVGSAEFAGGMPAPAKLGRLVGLIDRSGDWVVEPTYDSISPRPGGSDSDFKGFVVTRKGKSGLLDQYGNVVIDLQLEQKIEQYSGPVRRQDGGLTIILPGYHFPRFCSDGRIIGLVDQKIRFFTRDGKPLSVSRGEISWPPSCDTPIVVKAGERFGYVDEALQPITEVKFESTGRFHDGLAAVRLDGRFGLIRLDGTWALEPVFDAAQPLRNDVALVKLGSRAGLVNVTTGKLVTQMRFDDVCPLGRGIAGVMVDGQMGAVDENGHWVFQPKYDVLQFGFYWDFVPARLHGKWGLVDGAGNTIEAKFDEVTRFERGVSWAKSDGAWCPIDRRGDRIPTLPCHTANPRPGSSSATTMSCKIRP